MTARSPVSRCIRLVCSLLLVAGSCHWTSASAAETCLKLVFDRYCLGGDMALLLQRSPPPVTRQSKDESLAVVFDEGPNRLYVMAFRGRIYKVVRAYGTSTQLHFEDTYRALRDIYGAGQDESRFPDYATTTATRLAAIRRGDGQARHGWQPASDWKIELSWTRELGVALAYIATQLDAERAAKMDGGL